MSRCLSTLCLLLVLVIRSSASAPDADDGSSGSVKPRIPEPLYFDLVRPLGAEPGEFEVNSLFRRRLSGGQLGWAPEVEVALRGGWALEFELPMEGTRREEYKVAAQKTLGVVRRSYIHGWQGILEWDPAAAKWRTSQLYIAGLRFNRRWSLLSINGVGVGDQRTGRVAGLANNSVFRVVNRKLTTGLETNVLRGRWNDSAVRLLPQTHWRLPRRFNLQLSLGVEVPPAQRARPLAVWRLIREL